MLVDHLLKIKKGYKNVKQQETQSIYEVGKVWSQRDMACGNFKDFPRRAASDKVLRDEAAVNFFKNPKYDGC